MEKNFSKEHEIKFNLLLKEFLKPTYKLTNDVYLEMLITHLSNGNDYFELINSPAVTSWIEKSIDQLDLIDSELPSKHIVGFTIRLLSLLIERNELTFVTLNENNLFLRLQNSLNKHIELLANPSVKLANVFLMKSIIKHNIGVHWIKKSKLWKDIVKYCLESQTVYVVREATIFLNDFLYKSVTLLNDDQLCIDILTDIYCPLIENIYDKDIGTVLIDDCNLQAKVTPSINLICYILDNQIKLNENTRILHHILETFETKLKFWQLTQMTQDKNFLIKIIRTHVYLNFAELSNTQLNNHNNNNNNNNSSSSHNSNSNGQENNINNNNNSSNIVQNQNVDFNRFGVSFYNQIRACLLKNKPDAFLNITNLYHSLWHRLGDRAPQEIVLENQKLQFENQIILMQIMPILVVISRGSFDESELICNEFLLKLIDISYEHTLRICYKYRELLLLNSTYRVELAIKAIQGILSMKNILSRERGIIVFQALVYTLKHYINDENPVAQNNVPQEIRRLYKNDNCCNNNNDNNSEYNNKDADIGPTMVDTGEKSLPSASTIPIRSSETLLSPTSSSSSSLPSTKLNNKIDVLLENLHLMSAILTGIYEMVKSYKITWKDSLESISLLEIMLALLKNTNLTSKIVVQILKIVQVSIEQFLAPNLSLLVDTIKGSDMQELGPMIMKRLHDIEWEVRDSTLELLTSMTIISGIKYPAFQEHILENGICPVVVALAKHDTEPFVRASALHCLSKMVNIKIFWERYLSNVDLVPYLLQVLSSESEAIVRKEIIRLIIDIYIHQNIPKQYSDKLFSTLAHCAINDLYWEVKINALYFWRAVIQCQFQHHGMIDGTFPSVIFSKELKKIVTLTHNEILLRLSNILNELSLRGCLGILIECLNDACDLEVVKVTVMIIKELLSYLQKYKFIEEGNISICKNDEQNQYVPSFDTNYSEVLNIDCKMVKSSTERNDADVTTDVNSDNIIESILQSNDINLLSFAYENQLNVNKNDGTVIDEYYYRKFANTTPYQFIQIISTKNIDELLIQRTEWLQKTESFGSLLDDMLYSLKVINGINDIDCY